MSRAARRAAKAHRQRDSRETAAQRVAARRPNLEKVQQGWVASEQQLHDLNGRIALALSIVQHRHFCADCRPHVNDARQALLGKSIDEIRDGADAR